MIDHLYEQAYFYFNYSVAHLGTNTMVLLVTGGAGYNGPV
jgi:hypothetical protein